LFCGPTVTFFSRSDIQSVGVRETVNHGWQMRAANNLEEMRMMTSNPLKDPLLAQQNGSVSSEYVRIKVFMDNTTEPMVCIGWHMRSKYAIVEKHIKKLIGLQNNFKFENIEDGNELELRDLVYLPPGEAPVHCRLVLAETGWTEEIDDISDALWGRLRLLNGFRSTKSGAGGINANDISSSEFSNLVKNVIDELTCLDTGLTWLASERIVLNTMRAICVLAGATMKVMKSTSISSAIGENEMRIAAPFFFSFIFMAFVFAGLTYGVYRRMLSRSRVRLVEYLFSPRCFKDVVYKMAPMVICMLGALMTYFIVSHAGAQ
jgi:hypothetical protein